MKKACRRTVSAVLTLICLFSIMFFSCDGGFFGSSDDEIIFKTYDANSWRDTGNLYANRGRSVFRAPDDPSTENYTYKITLSRGNRSFSKSFGGGTVVVMENIPVGSWKITCRAYKSDGSLEYMGSVDAEVVANETTSATVELWKCPVVTFMDDGNVIASQTVEFGATVTKPKTPTKEGFTFVGWYKGTDTAETEFDFSTEINESITLYARWEEEAGLPSDDYIKIDLSPYAEQVSVCDYIHIYRKEEGTEDWKTVMFYSANNGYKLDPNVVLTDYYTKKGTTYSYKFGSTDLGTYTAKDGLGEITIDYGHATYNEDAKALEFDKLPSYSPELTGSGGLEFQIRYMVGSITVYFDMRDIKDGNRIYLKDALNAETAVGQEISPFCAWVQRNQNITEHCRLCWRAEPRLQGTNYYPTFTVPELE